ncbi:tRNA (adenosine(37)-N6)-threonylcarbamoyltransferase complex transferase subunit TsaD [Candidatus Berkelbacteria bacterium]|nr:tRNA (adenosine(37)-N6)-threonylcarbamoyltransferase complex transferase subunit TsaD [Candidatus Berkelbacteria bacterium]
MQSLPRILAIETSCDETAASIIEGNLDAPFTVLSNVVASQAALHAEYGGVFPDLAAREHTRRIIPVIALALKEAGLIKRPTQAGSQIYRALKTLDAIAVTVGPGLIGPLLIGATTGSQLAAIMGKPTIPVNHWEGHIYSTFLQPAQTLPRFPLLILTVSGGHTSLVLMREHFDYEILGKTVDDAAGEAFDKTARLLELRYPGGPEIAQAAARARENGANLKIVLPRPMLASKDFNFSFSGLKTAVRYALNRGDIVLPRDTDAAAAAIEDAILDVLIAKTCRAAQEHRPTSVALVGGVAANYELRRRLGDGLVKLSTPLFLPELEYTTDNAAMIGAAGLVRYFETPRRYLSKPLVADASMRLT